MLNNSPPILDDHSAICPTDSNIWQVFDKIENKWIPSSNSTGIEIACVPQPCCNHITLNSEQEGIVKKFMF